MGHVDDFSSDLYSSLPKTAVRRQRRSGKGRRHSWHVRASDKDAKVIVGKAERAGVSVPRLLVSSAVGSTRRSAVERKAALAVLVGVRRQLAGVGSNLNQLAHHANTVGELGEKDRLDETIESLETLRVQLEAVLAEVEKT